MNPLVYFSGASMGLALIFYSYAVWGEQITKKLKGKFIIGFLTGFSLDILGTSGMFFSAAGKAPAIHGVLGIAALAVMGVHALWATSVWRKKNEEKGKLFHHYSKYAYILWLCAFFSGPLLSRI